VKPVPSAGIPPVQTPPGVVVSDQLPVMPVQVLVAAIAEGAAKWVNSATEKAAVMEAWERNGVDLLGFMGIFGFGSVTHGFRPEQEGFGPLRPALTDTSVYDPTIARSPVPSIP
jgi:hypothetical protein